MFFSVFVFSAVFWFRFFGSGIWSVDRFQTLEIQCVCENFKMLVTDSIHSDGDSDFRDMVLLVNECQWPFLDIADKINNVMPRFQFPLSRNLLQLLAAIKLNKNFNSFSLRISFAQTLFCSCLQLKTFSATELKQRFELLVFLIWTNHFQRKTVKKYLDCVRSRLWINKNDPGHTWIEIIYFILLTVNFLYKNWKIYLVHIVYLKVDLQINEKNATKKSLIKNGMKKMV